MLKGRLIFDLTKTQPISNTIYHGGGIYGIIVLKRLLEISPDNIAIYYDPSRMVDQSVMNIVEEKSIIVYKSLEISIKEAARKEAGVIYNPIFDDKMISDDNIVVISTIHDIRDAIISSDRYEATLNTRKSRISHLLICCGLSSIWFSLSKKKRLVKIKEYLKGIENSNNRFITVSETSKYSMLTKIPSLKESNIKVLYSPDTINYNLTINDYNNIYGKYYLITSADRWMKNPVRTLIALDQLFSERKDMEAKVVITGLNNPGDLNLKLQNRDRFIFLGYVSEKELKALYHYAYLFIYPSLYEGFGYPPLEAMYEGTPVIASGSSAIIEVCGDSILYFNPYLVDEIKIRVLQMENPIVRREFIEKGLKRQKEISCRQKEDLDTLCSYILTY